MLAGSNTVCAQFNLSIAFGGANCCAYSDNDPHASTRLGSIGQSELEGSKTVLN